MVLRFGSRSETTELSEAYGVRIFKKKLQLLAGT